MGTFNTVEEVRALKKEPISLNKILGDGYKCDTPGCTADHSILFLHPRCHPDARSSVFVDKSDGTITMICNRCMAPVFTYKLEKQ